MVKGVAQLIIHGHIAENDSYNLFPFVKSIYPTQTRPQSKSKRLSSRGNRYFGETLLAEVASLACPSKQSEPLYHGQAPERLTPNSVATAPAILPPNSPVARRRPPQIASAEGNGADC